MSKLISAADQSLNFDQKPPYFDVTAKYRAGPTQHFCNSFRSCCPVIWKILENHWKAILTKFFLSEIKKLWYGGFAENISQYFRIIFLKNSRSRVFY